MPSSKTQLFPVITVVHGHVKCHAHPIVLCMYTCGHAFMIIEPNISKGRPRCYSHSQKFVVCLPARLCVAVL